MDPSKRDLVKSASRSLDILEYLASHPAGVNLTEIHQFLAIPLSSLHNIIMTMVQKGYLTRDETTLSYRLGPKIGQLASSYYEQVDLIRISEPYMNQLARLSGETASLTVLRDDFIVFIHKVVGDGVQQIVNPVGTTLAAHATGSGKAMLAYIPEGELDRLYPSEFLKSYSQNTISTKSKLKEELRKIALDGYAFDNEESAHGIWAVASCIRDRHGYPMAAISIAGLIGRIRLKNFTEWIEPLRETTGQLSFALGFNQRES